MVRYYIERGVLIKERPRFEYDPDSPRKGKLACTVCGREGWRGYGRLAGWQVPCMRGHAGCLRCGLVQSVKLDGSPRDGHGRCPGMPPWARAR